MFTYARRFLMTHYAVIHHNNPNTHAPAISNMLRMQRVWAILPCCHNGTDGRFVIKSTLDFTSVRVCLRAPSRNSPPNSSASLCERDCDVWNTPPKSRRSVLSCGTLFDSISGQCVYVCVCVCAVHTKHTRVRERAQTRC